jgi:hypothetical protein
VTTVMAAAEQELGHYQELADASETPSDGDRREILKSVERHGSEFQSRTAQRDLATALFTQGTPESFKEAEKICDKLIKGKDQPTDLFDATVFSLLGRIKLSDPTTPDSELHKIEQWAEKAMPIFQRSGEFYRIGQGYLFLAAIASRQGDVKTARKFRTMGRRLEAIQGGVTIDSTLARIGSYTTQG